jgi:hypothetical protein
LLPAQLAWPGRPVAARRSLCTASITLGKRQRGRTLGGGGGGGGGGSGGGNSGGSNGGGGVGGGKAAHGSR